MILRLICLVIFTVWLGIAGAVADERILSFHSDITVEPDGAFLVVETIEVVVEGRQIRRGIFRDFPTVFTLNGDRERKVGFELIDVKRDGRSETAKIENSSRFIRIRIGNANVLLTHKVHSYQITYRTNRQLRRFESHDEILWNVTGNGWAFPIDKASAVVRLPAGADVEDTIYFTGRYGEEEKYARQHISANGKIAEFESTKPLDPREGLTIGVKFTKNIVPPISTQQQLKWFFHDFLGEIIAFGGAAIVFLYYFSVWRRVGRDPPEDIVVPRWDVPDDVSPALAHYIYYRGLKKNGFTAIAAAALNLAVKGLVKLDNNGGEMTIRKVQTGAVGKLPIGEASLISRLNGQGGSLKIDKAHGKTVQAMATKFSSDMTTEHRNVFYRSNGSYGVLGAVISIVFAILALMNGNLNEEHIALFFPVLIIGIIVTVFAVNIGKGLSSGSFARKIQTVFFIFVAGVFVFNAGLSGLLSNFPSISNPWLIGGIATIAMINILFFFLIGAPTPLGQTRMAEIEGLRRYMSVAEEDRLNMLGSPEMSPQHYETLLPYAAALGCEKPWSKAFQGWLAAAVAAGTAAAVAYNGPNWYGGSDKFSPDTIGDAMGDIGSSMADSMTASMPAPKSSSSGFSGGGGGGFSGGGGGGGGGGGW